MKPCTGKYEKSKHRTGAQRENMVYKLNFSFSNLSSHLRKKCINTNLFYLTGKKVPLV